METLNNILVALDLSSLDEHLIKYSSFLAEKFQAKKVFFVHNIKKYEILDLFDEELKAMNLDQLIGDELNEKIEDHFQTEISWEVLISEDSNTESLIDYIVNKYQIDLTVVGNKDATEGSGTLTAKLLRLLKSHMVSVPKNSGFKLENIWVGTDFSNHSQRSFRFLEPLRKTYQIKLSAVHVYQVPRQFTPYLTQERAIPKIKQHLQQKSKRIFKKLIPTSPENMELIYAKEKSISEKLLFEVNKKKADLLVLSDRGANNISSLLIGSLVEELFNQESDVPLLIVK